MYYVICDDDDGATHGTAGGAAPMLISAPASLCDMPCVICNM
jgi:hypothetical protein